MDILFNSKTLEFAWLSNFSPYSVGIQPTAEHAYQASKSSSRADWSMVQQLPTPQAAKAWGKTQHPEGWDVRKPRVMEAVLRRKFMDHPELRWALIGTQSFRLVHLSPWDLYWGEDGKGRGQNMMGIILMKLRSEYIQALTRRPE